MPERSSAVGFCAKLVVFSVLASALGAEPSDNWEISVSSSSHIELLSENGTLLGTAMERYSKLKALSYDGMRNRFLVGGREDKNDTIYNLKLKNEDTLVHPIVSDLPDDVQGIAVDLLKNVVYWTDSLLKSISYSNLDGPHIETKLFHQFSEEVPQDIAIDSCSRTLYWTNRNTNRPSIELINLNTNSREVIVDTDLHVPHGIAIDSEAKRIFWVDMREGIYFRVESVRFDASGRQLIFEGTHQQPFDIGINEKSVFWTDINNNILWKMDRNSTENSTPTKVRQFAEKPLGLVVKSKSNTEYYQCPTVLPLVSSTEITEITDMTSEPEEINFGDLRKHEIKLMCLNGGKVDTELKSCVCPRGFAGIYCEKKMCDNFCLNGACFLSSLGFAQCRCDQGYFGNRCQVNLCENFCLNDGSCRVIHNATFSSMMPVPSCECKEEFSGLRCENVVVDSEILCRQLCEESERDSGLGLSSDDDFDRMNCRCGHTNYSSSMLQSTRKEIMERITDPVFLVMSAALCILLISVSVLSMTICRLRRRPRIKKRIIVNKSITPLTYTPQQSEHCEITIENCCNMNICETPCFEPVSSSSVTRGFQKDEKKVLLTHMEGGDDSMY